MQQNADQFERLIRPVPLDTNDEPKTGLILQGGGARGAYQVGVLKAIAEVWDRPGNPFPIISGTSVGAINASSIASHAHDFAAATERLEKLWTGLTTSLVFDPTGKSITKTIWRVVSSFGFGAKVDRYGWLDNRPLRRLLETEFDRGGLEKAFAEGDLEGFCVTTSCYACGIAVTYFEGTGDVAEWKRTRREGVPDKIRVDHLMASSALPFIFPAVLIQGTYQGDGAMRLGAPLSPAIRMGANRTLVVGVRDAVIQYPSKDYVPLYPSAGEMAGHSIDILFNDNLESDIERLSRINRLVRMIPPKKRAETHLKEIDFLMLQPSRDLREIAAAHEDEMPRAIHTILRRIGATGVDGRLPSYLLFEQGYIRALIELGYKDTLARRDEVKAFLDHDR